MQEKFMAGDSNKAAIRIQTVADNHSDVFYNGDDRCVHEHLADIYALGR